MRQGRWRPPESDRAIGLGFYASESPGAPGALKTSSGDFRVSEISAYPPPDPGGPFTVLRVESQDWEQHELAAALARRLGLAGARIRWAGTKDRRARSERLFSYFGAPPTRPLELPNVRVSDVYRSREGLSLGHHYGNSFEIRVRELSLPAEEARDRYLRVVDELRAAGGFPNLFGAQRFGEVRPVTHRVGLALVRADVAGAVDVYLTHREGGPSAGDDARRSFEAHRDPRRALREFPTEYRFERQMLERLARGDSPERALLALGRELRLLFVHAYQSWLFNRLLTERVRRGISLTYPEPGDRILRVARDGTVPGGSPVPVTEDNRSECRELVERGGARLAAPLVGFDTPLDEGPPSAVLRDLLAEDGIAAEQFRLPAFPELASRGSWRPAVVPVPPMGWSMPGPEEEPASIGLRFALPKGAYATVLLRELLKSGAEWDVGVSDASSAAY